MANKKLDKKNLEQLLLSQGGQAVKLLSTLLKQENKIATSELINSLDYDVVDTLNGLTLEIIASKHFDYVDQGRYPYLGKNFKPDYTKPPMGKWVPYKPIETWVRRKGFATNTEASAYAISRSIAYKGIKPIYAKDKVEKMLLKNLTVLIKGAVAKDIQDYIDNINWNTL